MSKLRLNMALRYYDRLVKGVASLPLTFGIKGVFYARNELAYTPN